MLLHTAEAMTTLTVITMGACVIHTINKKSSDSQ